MPNYTYKGPTSGVTLNTGTEEKPESKEIMLYNGKEYDLPKDNKFVQSLVRQGYLIPIAEEKPAGKKAKEEERK